MVPVNILGSAKPKNITMPKTKASAAEPRYRIEPRCKKQEASNRKTDENLKAERNYKKKSDFGWWRLQAICLKTSASMKQRQWSLSSPCSMHAPPEGDHNPGDNNFGIGLDPGVHFGVKKRGFGMKKITRSRKILRVVKGRFVEKKMRAKWKNCARSVHNRVVLGSLFNRNLNGRFVARVELQAFD